MNYLVIKCGGSVFEALPQSFYADIVNLFNTKEWIPVVVHGGGPLINSLLGKLGIETHFVNGLRVTTNELLDVVEMVLSGSVNKKVVRHLTEVGGKAFGISGVDGHLLSAQMIEPELGFVGEVVKVNHGLISQIALQGYIPVISPIGIDENGQRYNINGDIAASAIAKALSAKLCLVSDIPGILIEECGEKKVLERASKKEVEQLIENGTITGGMIPKVKAAIDGLEHAVPEVVILNGMEKHSLLDFSLGKKIGTKLVLHEHEQEIKGELSNV